MATYKIPAPYVKILKSHSYRELMRNGESPGFSPKALSAARIRRVISRQSYDNYLVPLLETHGVVPMPWEDVVTLAQVELREVRDAQLFRRMRALYHAGRDDLAANIGHEALQSRNPEVWFQGGWGLLSIANRVGQAETFVHAALLLRRRLAIRGGLPADDLRFMACDVSKWLLEHGEIEAAAKFYDPLVQHFQSRLDALPPQVAASLLRGHGTLLLRRRRFQLAKTTYLRSLAYSGENAEARLGTAFWLAELQAASGNSDHEAAWNNLQERIDSVGDQRPRIEHEPHESVSAQTLVSAKLLICQRHLMEQHTAQFKVAVAECANSLRERYKDLSNFIVPGTQLHNAVLHSMAGPTFYPLLRQPLRPEQVRTAVELLEELGRHISDDRV